MRIALIVPGGVDRSGHERVIPVILNIIERLARRHNVLVITLDQQQRCCYPLLGATVVALGSLSGLCRATRWLVGLQRLISVVRSEGGGCDVLHAFWAGRTATLALAAGRFLRVPVVVSIGGGELVWLPEIGYGGQGKWLTKTKTSLVLRKANVITGGSHYSLNPCIRWRPDARWLPLGVDAARFGGPVERPPGPPWRLLHVADINLVKDQVTLLEAMRLIAGENSDVRLDWIGVDTMGNRMQRMAADLGLDEKIRFQGFKPLDAIIPFYRQAHLFIQSSLHESMGAAVLEAAAAGVPTVGTAVGLVAEMAPNAAHAVPVRDAEALAEGILELLNHPEQRARLGHAAQQFARAYDADWTTAQFEAVYAKLIEPREIGGRAHGNRSP